VSLDVDSPQLFDGQASQFLPDAWLVFVDHRFVEPADKVIPVRLLDPVQEEGRSFVTAVPITGWVRALPVWWREPLLKAYPIWGEGKYTHVSLLVTICSSHEKPTCDPFNEPTWARPLAIPLEAMHEFVLQDPRNLFYNPLLVNLRDVVCREMNLLMVVVQP
jgi:hypothetical protein